MAICSKCGAQLFETSKFCPECGTPVLEVSADTNKTGNIYSASENADDENSMAVFQGIDPSEISPDETAEILEAAAEKALEDIPEIVKIEGVDIHTEKPEEISSELPEASKVSEASKTPEASKAEKQEEKKEPEKEAPAKDDFSDMGAYVADSSEFKKMAEKVSQKKKGGKTAAIIIAAVVIVAAVGAGVYFMGGHNSSQPAVDTTVTVTEAADEAVTEVSVDNEITSDSEISDTEVTTVTETETEETTESETTEAVTEAVSMKTAEEFAAGIEITPEHKAAAENEASCTVSLAAEGLSADMLSDGGLLVVSYTAETAQTGTIPVTVYMTVTVGGTDIDVVASSSGDGVAVFEFANMASAVAENGFSAADIDCISFKGTGAGVDVTSITVMKG
ncbi:Predicted membrane protein [uncultured Ruminococcus sp.]|uniref:zinc ribbon domain-containing protein n=1 Tax=Huintestinicola butyrica TaxID=2981728 RepID=UPI000821C314|nr:zinc ribbon domain-containing protein [Huintestinicola butyrica]MCU6726761.1 zinc ribbon domain-containing protein [Huintestinicola butyrica]SCI60088.1 Predicted membrane protein [uncultured Ruminococcus sp.]